MDDLISRQAAIDVVKTLHDVAWKNWHEPTLSANVLLDMIRELPSAEPEKVLVAEVKLSKDQIQSAVDEAVEKMRKELDPCDFCKHKDDCGYMSTFCPAERIEE